MENLRPRLLGWIYLITHSSARVLYGRRHKSVGNGKFDPSPRRAQTPKPIVTIVAYVILSWIGYLATGKIYSRSLKGLLFHVCEKLHIKNVYSATLFLASSNAPQPRLPNRFSYTVQYILIIFLRIN